MKQFAKFNIVVNHNPFTSDEFVASLVKAGNAYDREVATNPALRREIETERRESLERWGFYDENSHKDDAVKRAMRRDSFLDEIRASKRTVEGARYEKKVIEVLGAIEGNGLGKQLLGMIDPQHRVWIVPTKDDNAAECSCVAATTPGILPKASGGGVRVYFTPVDGQPVDGFYSNEDILFHELVHAYRATRIATARHWRKPLREYVTQEEVLAVHVTNVYRATRNFSSFYRAHTDASLMNPHVLYRLLAHDRDVFYTIAGFLKEDKLAQDVARLTAPMFNPWRDFARLQQIRDTEIDMT